jgi:hypothetical protein
VDRVRCQRERADRSVLRRTRVLAEGEVANVEVITAQVTDDLFTWRKEPSIEIRADARWHEKLGDSDWPVEVRCDPWVYHDGDI